MHIINLSHMTTCQVYQKITLSDKGPSEIKSLLANIKSAIRQACPKLIDDSKQPFGMYLTDMTGDSVVISIETHHDIPRLGDEYWENRQTVLMAINQAVLQYKAHG